MSYSAEVKASLCTEMPKHPCCRRALLSGLLFSRGEADAKDCVTLTLAGEELLCCASHLIREQCGREAKRIRRTDAVAADALFFVSGTAAAYLHALCGSTDGGPLYEERCSGCGGAFLRGFFLGAGHLRDPKKSYGLAFSCGERREAAAAFLRSFGLAPKYADRRRERLLYFRDSESIEEILTRIGATQTAFSLMDRKIEAGMRNEANRLANCDANNIDKSIAASHRQIEVIRRLVEANKLSFLPPELVETAKARLENEDLSLGQLAARMQPPITKSGLNHRLTHILQLAEHLLEPAQEGTHTERES